MKSYRLHPLGLEELLPNIQQAVNIIFTKIMILIICLFKSKQFFGGAGCVYYQIITFYLKKWKAGAHSHCTSNMHSIYIWKICILQQHALLKVTACIDSQIRFYFLRCCLFLVVCQYVVSSFWWVTLSFGVVCMIFSWEFVMKAIDSYINNSFQTTSVVEAFILTEQCNPQSALRGRPWQKEQSTWLHVLNKGLVICTYSI